MCFSFVQINTIRLFPRHSFFLVFSLLVGQLQIILEMVQAKPLSTGKFSSKVLNIVSRCLEVFTSAKVRHNIKAGDRDDSFKLHV
jgi:hypothetical protein